MPQEQLDKDLQHCIDGYSWAKAEILRVTEGLSQEDYNWKSNPKSWSVGECIDHCYLVGHKFLAPMHEAIEDGKRTGKVGEGPFRYGWFATKFYTFAAPRTETNTMTGKSPKLYVPPSTITLEESVANFTQLQDNLIAVCHAAQGVDLRRVRVTSPAFWFIRFSIGAWLLMLDNHQRRHFQQAERVLASRRSAS